MTSRGSKQVNPRRPLVRDWFGRLRRPLFRATAPAPSATLETWENEDFLQTSEDEEAIFDPWHEDMPEQRLVSRETVEPEVPESPPHATPIPPLPLDPSFAEQPEAQQKEEARAEPPLLEESENPPVVDIDGEDKGDDWDEDDLEEDFGYSEDPDADYFETGPDIEIELFDYDAEAHQSVWDDDPEDVADLPLRARQKAAEVVSRLSFTSQRERHAILPWLIDLFQHRNHPTTYRAILAAVDSGVSSETLRNMAALRDIWEDRQEWWLGRYGWGRSVRTLRNGDTALTWKLARSICEARSDFPPEYMIDDSWMHEWLCLPPYDDKCRNFPQFIGMKVMAVDETFQDVPSWSDLQQSEPDEFGDHRNQVESAFSDVESHAIAWGHPLPSDKQPNSPAGVASQNNVRGNGDGN